MQLIIIAEGKEDPNVIEIPYDADVVLLKQFIQLEVRDFFPYSIQYFMNHTIGWNSNAFSTCRI
jgi:hypothetical protein